MKIMRVVAAVVYKNGEVLLARRLPHKRYAALMWEFVGGKVEAGETNQDALVRELGEEIGIDASAADMLPFGETSQVYGDTRVDISFYLVENYSGTPQGLEGQELRTVPTSMIRTFPLVPYDAFLYEKIAGL